MLSFNLIFLILICITLAKNESSDEFLTHYWPIYNSSMNDVIDNADMSQGISTIYVSDRFGKSNSALGLNGGWTQVPSGIYLNANTFTISVWIYPQNVGSYSRIIDFGNGNPYDNVILRLSTGSDLKPGFVLYTKQSGQVFQTTNFLTTQNWQLITVTYNSSNISFYVNGSLELSKKCSYARFNELRKLNYIGKGWSDSNHFYSSSYIDDLRFYNKCLTQNEILDLMYQKDTGE